MMENILLRLLPVVYSDLGLTNFYFHFAWTMQETMMYWPNIFQCLFHPFGGWQLMDAVFHTLLISWLKYVLLKFYTILES
ncbi:hypothetical protein L208DRAFT_1543053, partial [Tricholoma matsutake]